jgi:hypothetical protein
MTPNGTATGNGTGVREHPMQRLSERLGCSPRKVEKVIAKAWRSVEPPPKWFAQKERINADRKRVLRYMMGYAFVFSENGDFVTVLDGGRIKKKRNGIF